MNRTAVARQVAVRLGSGTISEATLRAWEASGLLPDWNTTGTERYMAAALVVAASRRCDVRPAELRLAMEGVGR